MSHPTDIIYAPGDRPRCTVQLDAHTDTGTGTAVNVDVDADRDADAAWVPGHILAWHQRQDGWAARITWTPEKDGAIPVQRTLPAAQVRQVLDSEPTAGGAA